MTERHYDYSLKTSIQKILKQVHPDQQISGKALETVNLLLHNVFDKIIRAAELANIDKTLNQRDIQTAVRLVFPGELVKHAISEGTKANTKFEHNPSGTRKARVPRSQRAGLQLQPSIVENLLRKYRQNDHRISESAPVFLAGVLEYIIAEIMELSGNIVRDERKRRISNHHIFLAIMRDEEFARLFQDVNVNAVVPHIHPQLLPKKKVKKEKEEEYVDY